MDKTSLSRPINGRYSILLLERYNIRSSAFPAIVFFPPFHDKFFHYFEYSLNKS